MNRSLRFLLPAFLFSVSLAQAKLELPAFISDHMVLQQGIQAPLWGKDKPGQEVTVSLNGQSAKAVADKDGKWKTNLPKLDEGGPFELLIEGSESVTVKDVLVGEVWVASGQSNMELPLNNTNGGTAEAAKAKDNQFRWYVEDRALTAAPMEKANGAWKICSPDTAKDFSGTAYYFGKHLRQSLKVPVAIVGTYWGGTWIESWIPQESYKSDPALKASWDKWNALTPAEKNQRLGMDKTELLLSTIRLLPKDPSKNPVTVLVGPDPKAPQGTLGGAWSSNAQAGSSITFTSHDVGGPKPGPIGDLTASIQAGGWGNSNTSFSQDRKPTDLSAYEAVEFYAKGTGKFNMIISQPIVTDWDNYGSEPFELTKDWALHKIALSSLKQSGWGQKKPWDPTALTGLYFNVIAPPMSAIPSGLYNGQVNPLVPYGMKGVIWYQGETNEGNAPEYKDLLPALIRGWRAAWGQGDFPFIYAQLPNFKEVKLEPSESAWAEIREGQRLALAEPNTGMATLIDVGEANDIHPKDKKDVGDRLALAALHVAYNEPGPFSGPLFDSMTVDGKKATLKFKYAEGGLVSKGGKKLRGFAVAGEDGKYQWAKAKIVGSTVEVWADEVAAPKSVRYAWADNPVCNLFGKNGLPASPFQARAADSK
ncbi:MAG TPA: sialate O-acetylesterase [bacterium]|nr:sialate O-acetylesterase [bacterium]